MSSHTVFWLPLFLLRSQLLIVPEFLVQDQTSFPLAALKIVFLFLYFSTMHMRCLVVEALVLILLGVDWVSWINNVLHQIYKVFKYCFLEYFFLSLVYVLFLVLSSHICSQFNNTPNVSEVLFFFFACLFYFLLFTSPNSYDLFLTNSYLFSCSSESFILVIFLFYFQIYVFIPCIYW